MDLVKLSKNEQLEFIKNIFENKDVMREEYLNLPRKSIPLYGFDGTGDALPEWRTVTLWWDYQPWKIFQKYLPKSTELVRYGPTHRGTGWLILRPHSKTPIHNHIDWGHRIILHVPMVIPDGDLGFWVDGKIHRWQMGELFAFDANKNHYGFNNTDYERSIMVMDFDYSDWYDTLRPYMLLEN